MCHLDAPAPPPSDPAEDSDHESLSSQEGQISLTDPRLLKCLSQILQLANAQEAAIKPDSSEAQVTFETKLNMDEEINQGDHIECEKEVDPRENIENQQNNSPNKRKPVGEAVSPEKPSKQLKVEEEITVAVASTDTKRKNSAQKQEEWMEVTLIP